MRYLTFSLIFLLILACKKTDQSPKDFVPPQPGELIGHNVDIDAIISRRGKALPEACSIIPIQLISDVLDIPVNQITIKDSSPRDIGATHNSCFFKWEDPSFPNSGILIQGLINPVPNEFPDYVVRFIDSKRTLGENTMAGTTEVFKKLEGFGDDGCYSVAVGSYFWRLGDKVILSIAFNSSHNPEQQYTMAMILAKALTENYINGN